MLKKLLFLILIFFTFSGYSQCTLTGTIDSENLKCGISPLISCNGILYIGNGIDATTLNITKNLDLTCLGAIRLIVRNNATLNFSKNVDFKLGDNSSIEFQTGSNLTEAGCTGTTLIKIKDVKVANCNGNSAELPFAEILTKGGYNFVKTAPSPTVSCGSGGFALTANAFPYDNQTEYRWYTVSSGGTPLSTGVTPTSDKSSSTYTTPVISATTTYYVEAETDGLTTPRFPVVVTVIPLPATPQLTVTQPDCSTSKGTIKITTPTGLKYSIDGSNYSNTSGIFASLDYKTYTVTAKNAAGCISSVTPVTIVDPSKYTTTWNGTAWTNGKPTFSVEAIITVDYNTALNGDLDVCSLKINSNSKVTIGKNGFVTIQNNLTLQPNSTLDILDKGSLVMVNDLGTIDNKGAINVNKTTSPFEKYDYIYWSSPIVGPANIVATLPTWNTDYAFAFHPENFSDANEDGFDDNQDDWLYASTMNPGRGYIVMGPTSGSFPRTESVVFSGTVNNGVVKTPIELTPGTFSDDDFNLVGNPYPSAISADALITANISASGTINKTIEGTLYFWTHKDDISLSNPGPDANNYSQDDYAVYNLSGGTGTSGSKVGGVEQSNRPLGYIASGQSFFVEADVAGVLTFNNAMRVSPALNSAPITANSQFYKILPVKDKTASKDRVWLNLENKDGMFSQQLVGYLDGTTIGIDNGYDGLVSDAGNYVSFYSLANDGLYKIQSRGAFDEKDEVPLGYFSAVAGQFNINIDSQEGVFDEKTTNVYLEDKVTHTIYDLKESPYSFETEAGTFNDRFVLHYTNKTLGSDDFEKSHNAVLVSNKNKQIKINSTAEMIDGIQVFDLQGRLIYKKMNVNTTEFLISNLVSNHQALVVKVTLSNGKVISKKVIY